MNEVLQAGLEDTFAIYLSFVNMCPSLSIPNGKPFFLKVAHDGEGGGIGSITTIDIH
ncbi:hypothetical protein N9Z55_03890 [Akkermansiaceae bacterium]|nr:hypothetical protein [Akkermansiaceae bacterium]